jgi:hypothetical protein
MGVSHVVWWVGGAAAAVGIARAAAALHSAKMAPIILLPLGTGLALAVALVGLAVLANVRGHRLLIASAVGFAVLCVLAEHAWLYRGYRQQWWRDRVERPGVAIFRPETSPLLPVAYFAREVGFSPGQTALWAIDAALIVAATISVVELSNRQLSPPEP